MDGKLVPWDQAQVHVLSHSLHYGLGVFEGIRCYKGQQGSFVFRLKEHIARFFASAHIMQMKLPFAPEQIESAVVETVRANRLEACYIRPIAFIGAGEMGLYVKQNPIHVVIAAWPWGTYLGDDGVRNGIRVKISSFARHHVNISMTRAKVTGYYVNSQLAKQEAKQAGYDEALLLDTDGFVAEGPGENLFLVRNGVLKTTLLTSVLEGITRDSVMQLARDAKIQLQEERFTRDELYIADEAFFTGTAAELTPIREVDGRMIGPGKPGPITQQLQERFFSLVRGGDPTHRAWLTSV